MDAPSPPPECADTPLARLLHARGRLPLDAIQTALAESRAARPGGPDLVARLIERGLLDAQEAARWQADLGAPLWGPGAIVGEHRLLERLGAGGMGAVDLAEHLPTGARRAIKSLALTGDPELAARFQREGEAMARAGRHPAVVRVHAVGAAWGRHYLVMEHLPGGDLSQRLRAGPLAPDEVRRVGIALARGLAHVHACGVLHRDLKAQNVLFDAAGDPVLVDFGLARTSGAEGLTRTGDLVGTPACMAPEQALGLVRELDERTDVYGLGVVLYHALAGRLPFEGRSQMAIMDQVVNAPPEPPSRRVAGVPPALEAVILRALEKRPAQRWPSAAALAQALEAAGGDPVAQPRAPRVLPTLLAGALGVLVLASALAVWVPERSAPVASRSPAARRPTPAPVASISSAESGTYAGLPRRMEEIPRLEPGMLGSLEPGERAELERLIEVMGPTGLLIAGSSLRQRSSAVRPMPANERRVRLTLAAVLLHEVILAPDSDRALQGEAWRQVGEMFLGGDGLARDHAEGVRCLERGIALEDTAAYLRLAELYMPRRPHADPPRAAALIREGLARGAEIDQRALLVLLLFDLCEADPELVGWEEASQLGEAVLARAEDDDWLRLRVAHCEVRAGSPERARANLRRLIDHPGWRVDALALLARICAEPERSECRARLLGPESQWIRAEMTQLASWHENEGRVADAARLLLQDAQLGDYASAGSAEALIGLCERQQARGEPPFRSRAELEALLEGSAEGRSRLARRRAEGR